MLAAGVKERFMAKVQKSDGCWTWTAGKFETGYGAFHLNGKLLKAHRVAWHLSTGSAVPSGKMVCHHCDNPVCVRPDHLFLGTALDNARDRNAKGRQARGEKINAGRQIHRGASHWSVQHPERLARGDRNGSRLRPESRPKGDAHYSRTKPELLPRGDRNGSRIHPESRPRGESHASAKLTAKQVAEIRQALTSKSATQQQLAERYGVSRSLISSIKTGTTWKHVQPAAA